MVELPEAGSFDISPPRLEIVEAAVAAAGPALLVTAPRVRAEQDAAGPEGRGEVFEDARQLAARHVEQRGIREHPVEAGRRQVERQEVLVQHLAAGPGARHGNERARAVEADDLVAERGEPAQVPAGPASQVEDRVGRLALHRPEQGLDVLADVVVGGAAAVGRRNAVIFRNCDSSGLVRLHAGSVPDGPARRPGAPAGIREDHRGLDLAFRNGPVAPQQP